ncbi:MAG: hypothetical protein QM662_05840 [Gordonia sp. (in: high G+C Gram-positive bacteria)]
MADDNARFGFDPEEFDRLAREAGEGLREIFGRIVAGSVGPQTWSSFVNASSPAPAPQTAGEAGSGVWAVFVVDDAGTRVEQVYATELEALRANQHNTDGRRRVRFLPYGIAVSALDIDLEPGD